MIVRNPNTTESPLRKRNLLTVRYLVCSFLAGFCSLTKSVPVAALTITVEVEHGVTLDHRGNTIYLGDENYLFITPEGKIVFPGSILDYTDGNLILTSAKGAAPVILVTAPLSNDRVFDFEDFAFDGNRYVAYLDRNGNVSVVDVETGAEDQQGAFAYDVMAVTAFGEALYANREEDRIRRIMLDEIVVYTDGGVFEGFNVSRISSTKVTANAAADVFFILSGSSEETGSIALAVKNGIIVDTGSIEEIWPYLGSAYILFMSNGDVLINGTDQIDNGELWAEFTVVAENGDIYFMGNDGIYLYDADADVDAGEENLSLLINETDFGVSGTTPVGRTSRGDLVFVGNGGVFLYDTSNSEVISLLVEDDEVDGRPVDSIYWSYDSYELQGIGLSEDVVAIRGEIDGEPAIFRIELYPETGPVYTVSELCPEIPAGFAENQSFEESESIYPDPFTSSDPIDLREGPCGGNWHTRIWKETATGEELDFVPGAEGHTDNIVSVKETDLVISDGPIILESADLTGSLEISSPLTLSKDSNIQDLIQGSDMVINGILELSGANVWRNGSTEGTGSVRIQSASKLDIDLLQGSRFLGLEIQTKGTGKIAQTSGTLSLGGDSKITIDNSGEYEFDDGGTITGTSGIQLLLKDQGKLIFKSPNAIQERLGVKIDVGVDTNGTSSIQLNPHSSVNFSNIGTYQDNTTFWMREKSSIHFNAPQTFSNDSSFFNFFDSPEERPTVMMDDLLTVLNGTLTLEGLKFNLNSNLDVILGQLYNKTGEIVWQKGIIFGGSIDQDGELQFGLKNQATLLMGSVIPEGGFQLNGTIENAGLFKLSHSLNLADQSRIINSGDLILGGSVAIRVDLNGSAQLENSGAITKLNAGTSEILIPVSSMKGGIIVRNDPEGGDSVNSSLVLRRASDFLEKDGLRVENLAQLEFAIFSDEKLTIHDQLQYLDLGTVKLTDTDVLIKSGARLKVEGGQHISISSASGDEWLEGSGGWVIDGKTTTIEGSGKIEVTKDGFLKWRKGTITGADQNGPIINNSGLMEISGSGSHQLDGSLVNEKQLTIAGSVTGTGQITNNELGSTVILENEFDIGVKFSNYQKVIATFGADATFSGPVDQLWAPLGTLILTGGDWIVNNTASVMLMYENANKDIGIIDRAFVELRGSGTLNNLHNVSGNLKLINSGTLHYRDTVQANISGQLSIIDDGALRLFNSKLDIAGDLQLGRSLFDFFGAFSLATLDVNAGSTLIVQEEFEVNTGGSVTIDGVLKAASLDIATKVSFSGTGTINGSKFNNFGKLIPGKSPGVLTIEGDYEQMETGELEIEVFGAEVGTEYDQLVVTGTAILDGTLHIIPKADIPAGTFFEPLVANSIEGAFSRIIVETESARSTYEVSTTSTNIQITPQTLSVTTFTEFQSALFSAADAADEEIGLSTSDPDNDQFSNLLEYAMDLNPWVTNNNPLTAEFETNESDQFSRVKVKFPWAKDMTDVDYVLQTSPDMTAWTDLPSTLEDTIDEGTHNFLTVGATIDPPAGRLFVRILVIEL